MSYVSAKEQKNHSPDKELTAKQTQKHNKMQQHTKVKDNGRKK